MSPIHCRGLKLSDATPNVYLKLLPIHLTYAEYDTPEKSMIFYYTNYLLVEYKLRLKICFSIAIKMPKKKNRYIILYKYRIQVDFSSPDNVLYKVVCSKPSL